MDELTERVVTILIKETHLTVGRIDEIALKIHKEYKNSGYVKLSANQELPKYSGCECFRCEFDRALIKETQEDMVMDDFRRVEID